SQNVASAGVPASLQSSTIKAAILFAVGQTTAGAISPTVIALTEGVLESMLVSKTRVVTALILLVLILGVRAGLLRTSAQSPPAPKTDPAPVEKKAEPRVKWEYKAITPDDVKKLARKESKDRLTDGLNVLGGQGWELVAVQPGTAAE